MFQKQAERFGAQVEFDSAYSVDLSKRPFKVVTDNGEILADALDHRHRRQPDSSEYSGRNRIDRQGHLVLCHLRWLVL